MACVPLAEFDDGEEGEEVLGEGGAAMGRKGAHGSVVGPGFTGDSSGLLHLPHGDGDEDEDEAVAAASRPQTEEQQQGGESEEVEVTTVQPFRGDTVGAAAHLLPLRAQQ